MTVLEQRFLETAIRWMNDQEKATKEITSLLRSIDSKLEPLIKQETK